MHLKLNVQDTFWQFSLSIAIIAQLTSLSNLMEMAMQYIGALTMIVFNTDFPFIPCDC